MPAGSNIALCCFPILMFKYVHAGLVNSATPLTNGHMGVKHLCRVGVCFKTTTKILSLGTEMIEK